MAERKPFEYHELMALLGDNAEQVWDLWSVYFAITEVDPSTGIRYLSPMYDSEFVGQLVANQNLTAVLEDYELDLEA